MDNCKLDNLNPFGLLLSAEANGLLEEALHYRETEGPTRFAANVGASEFSYSLADGIGREWDGPLGRWRENVLRLAIDDRDNQKSWTNHFESLGATRDQFVESTWRRVRGVMRVCLVQIISPMDAKTTPRKENFQDGAFPELLPHLLKSLQSDVKFFPIETKDLPRACVCRIDDGRDSTNESPTMWHGWVLEFPNGICMRVVSCCFLLDAEEFCDDENEYLSGIYDKGSLKHKDRLTRIQAVRRSMEQDRDSFGKKHDARFWMILDAIDNENQTLDNELLTYAFRRLCGQRFERARTARIEPNGLMMDGVVGLEGTVVVRRLRAPASGRLVPGDADRFWGGSAWVAWIVTIFQRAATERLAVKTAEFGTSLLELEKDNNDENEYWKQVIQMESKWMYRAIAGVSDIDRIYRSFQSVFDIEAMWSDVREQTELIARYSETKRVKRVNSWQVIGGFVFGASILLVGYFGMNFFDKDILQEHKEAFVDAPFTVVVLITMVMMFWWWIETSQKISATWLRQRLILHRRSCEFKKAANGIGGTTNNRQWNRSICLKHERQARPIVH